MKKEWRKQMEEQGRHRENQMDTENGKIKDQLWRKERKDQRSSFKKNWKDQRSSSKEDHLVKLNHMENQGKPRDSQYSLQSWMGDSSLGTIIAVSRVLPTSIAILNVVIIVLDTSTNSSTNLYPQDVPLSCDIIPSLSLFNHPTLRPSSVQLSLSWDILPSNPITEKITEKETRGVNKIQER